MNKEELLVKREDIKKDIDKFNAMQNAQKLILNSIYGSFGNTYFFMYNSDIAGSITAMGRDLIQYMIEINDYYWYNKWHLDYKVHSLLGVTDVKPIDGRWIHSITKDIIEEPTLKQIESGEIVRKEIVSVYADTDSLYCSFQPAMKSCGWDGDSSKFIFTINDNRIEKYFQKKLLEYADKYKVENIHEFEMEKVNKTMLMLKKKKYIQNTIWEDGVEYKTLTNLVPKGVDLIQRGTPPFARDKIKSIVNYLMDDVETNNIKDILNFIKKIKEEFMLQEIEDISLSGTCKNYHVKVLNDTSALECESGSHFLVVTSAHYNYLLNQNAQLKSKYTYIKNGNKIKYYHCISNNYKYFGYNIGNYPMEFAPEINYDVQFEKTILKQVNTYITVLGMPELNKRLSVVFDLFAN